MCLHETPLTWKDTNINNANVFSPKKEAKNNDCAASVVALVHAHTPLHHRSCDSFNQLAKKLVTCLVPSLARACKRRQLG